MLKSHALTGLAAIFFAAAAQASPDGSLTVSQETRAVLGGGIIDFAARHIVNQPALPVISGADCGTDGKASPALRAQFAHPTWTADKACHAFGEGNWKSAGGRYEFSDKNNDENILLMLDVARSMQDVAKTMGVAEMGLKLPGTAQDWNTLLLFHELQHSREHINGTRVAETTEYYADLAARGYYSRAYAQGLVSDPCVPDALRGLRILDDIANARDGDTHNIALLAGLPGIDLDETNTPARISRSFIQARSAIYKEIGLPTQTEAEKAARDNPNLLYRAARGLYLKGAFDHDPVQKAYAGEFIRAAETYGADYYRIEKSIDPAPTLVN
jgi:hypothetical protein